MRCSGLILGLVALSISACVVFAQDSLKPSGLTHDKLSPEAKTLWTSRFDAIQKELSELDDHPWAGEYYHGDGLGANATLTLAPGGGFAFIWTGCLGVYDRNYGAVIPTARGSLKLDLTYENSRRGFQGVAEELVPIVWGNRHYLIPLDGVVGFCNEVNSQREPRGRMHGSYYLRRGDHEKPVDGVPKIPEQYQAYLLSKPIQAEIVAVDATSVEEGIGGLSFHKTTVTLNVGRSVNVLPGMSFHVYEPGNILAGCGARVLSVTDSTCEVLINQLATDKITPLPPSLGWKLTTGSRFSGPDNSHEVHEKNGGH